MTNATQESAEDRSTVGPGVPVVSVVTHKGGVGKSILCANIAAAWARAGVRVLVVDTDPQGNVSGIYLRADLGETALGLADVLEAAAAGQSAPKEAVRACSLPGVGVIGGGQALDELDGWLKGEGAAGEDLLYASLSSELCAGYDVVLIDTPPSRGPLVVGAIIAADLVVTPVSCQDGASVDAVVATSDMLAQLVHDQRAVAEQVVIATRTDTRTRGGRVTSREILALFDPGEDGSPPAINLPLVGRIPESAVMHQSALTGVASVVSHSDGLLGVALARAAADVLARVDGSSGDE